MNGKRAAIIASLLAVLVAGGIAILLVVRARSLALAPATPSGSTTVPAGERPSPVPAASSGGATVAPAGVLPLGEDAPHTWTGAAVADADADGLSAVEEQQAGSDPAKADTDADGLSDFDEVRIYCTDPRQARTDGATPDAEWVARRAADAQASGQRAAYCVQ